MRRIWISTDWNGQRRRWWSGVDRLLSMSPKPSGGWRKKTCHQERKKERSGILEEMTNKLCHYKKPHHWIEVSIGGLPHLQCASCGITQVVPLTVWGGGQHVLPDWGKGRS